MKKDAFVSTERALEFADTPSFNEIDILKTLGAVTWRI